MTMDQTISASATKRAPPTPPQTGLEKANSARAAAHDRREKLLAAMAASKSAVTDATNARVEIIGRAAQGDASATHEAIHRAGEALRNAEVALEIEEAKVAAIDDAIEAAEREVLRAQAEALSDQICRAWNAEAQAFHEFHRGAVALQEKLAQYHAAVQTTARTVFLAELHNRQVDHIAHGRAEAAHMANEPRPVTITVSDGPTCSMSRDGAGNVIEIPPASSSTGDTSILVKVGRRGLGLHLGELCTATYSMGPGGGGFKVRTISDLDELEAHYGREI